MKLCPALLLPAVIVATLGCSGGSDDEEVDDAAITAEQANARDRALADHVLVAAPADKKSQEKLGICLLYTSDAADE